MNILITGGKGFIGSAIANSLKESHNITILDNFSFEYPGYKYIYSDQGFLKLLTGIDSKHRLSAKKHRDSLISGIKIINCWSYEDFDLEDSIDLIINCGSLAEPSIANYFEDFTEKSIFDSIINLKKKYKNTPILHFSDLSVYGDSLGIESSELNPTGLYSVCKKVSESLLSTETDIILRISKVYGYGDGNLPLPMLLEKEKPIDIEEVNCIYIKDLINIINTMINKWIPGIYNISSGYKINTNTINQ